jgi:predicted nucleic acid-binding protein
MRWWSPVCFITNYGARGRTSRNRLVFLWSAIINSEVSDPSLIYVETTIPSFHTERRTAIGVQARRNWTREWWTKPKPNQRLVTSVVVFEELEKIPDAARRAESIALVRPLEQLNFTEEIAEIADVYIHHKLMPSEATGDADHLALASFYNCDMLVTWNCRHLANAHKAGHIRRVNALLGFRTPLLVTPLELLEKDYERET